MYIYIFDILYIYSNVEYAELDRLKKVNLLLAST